MGHCNMLLAVAGLDKIAVADRTRRLAGGDWSGFTPDEQAAFAYARKLARGAAPTADDFAALAARLGRDRAVDVVWWTCHCHYMTRVADAFQLPLEDGNVFDGFQAAVEGPRKP
jgi:alkylhydroperoxidase family enzyme